jgi:hypothetical protein
MASHNEKDNEMITSNQLNRNTIPISELPSTSTTTSHSMGGRKRKLNDTSVKKDKQTINTIDTTTSSIMTGESDALLQWYVDIVV